MSRNTAKTFSSRGVGGASGRSLPPRRMWSACLAVALLACIALLPARAHMIELLPASKECFFEDLHIGDQMTLTYQVGGGGGHLDIDTTLTEPSGQRLYELYRKDTGTYSFTAQHDGRYEYCFSNEFSTVSDKTVSFNVHGIIYVPDDGEMQPIEREIRDLAAGLQAIKDEQEYLVVRERVHRNTAESTNTRVKWWSIAQGIMLLGVCGVQIFFVKR
ncbi:supernatant protein factor, C-terminal domain-containing protein [Tilletiaria anomala UBC 951]|uniref:Supernatant protein factor, C-terminal domain-containing protein n=1 Tax=Tilletiaria anomala (strain ATCC 24038 / CBS 436.72 / UBC 951) TaxID=1037660 RepID=A0A066VKN3_TILAU|nr:supernatant protein factor, C-terminal domain-containing protein [Tilletiaria anomala UBC 951]KDN42297.1 supernatant protein factor, C-terminal domain-containing protein [Tilletiaria anomala UBC 951]